MGNSASSSRSHHDDTVDYGFLTPQGVYTGPRDWNQQVVSQLIIDRRLAPFYRPLEEYDESWDDEQILAARKVFPEQDAAAAEAGTRPDSGGTLLPPSRPSSINSPRRPGSLKEPSRIPEAMIYRDAIECPICFLYYPPNINRSRCCDQAICTECFVQIKRAEPTTTHVVSEPAACPYCVQDNFGVTYQPPPWRAGMGAEASSSSNHLTSSRTLSQQSVDSKGRRKSFSADSPEVATTDQIRPDWEAKLAAVRAAVARRANRRIIMRQVGDRLIPVGVTSGRLQALANGEIPLIGDHNAEGVNENEGRSSRRSRRRHHQQPPGDLNNLLGGMGLGGQDLEELMVMEAMRLSLLEHEEQQRKEAEKKKKEEQVARGNKNSASGGNGKAAGPSTSASNSELPPVPVSAPIDASTTSASTVPRAIPSSLTVDSSLGGSSPNSRSQRSSFDSPRLHSSGFSSSQGAGIAHSDPRSHSRNGSAAASHLSTTPSERATVPSPAQQGASQNGSASPAPAATIPSTQVPLAPLNSSSDSTEPIASVPHPIHSISHSSSVPPASSQQIESLTNESSTSLISDSGNRTSIYNELPSSPESISQRPLLLQTPAIETADTARVLGAGPENLLEGYVDAA